MNLLRSLAAASIGLHAGLPLMAGEIAPPPRPTALTEPSGGALVPAVRESAVPGNARGPRRAAAAAMPEPGVAPEPDVPAVATTFDSVNFDENAAGTGFFNIPPDPHGAAGPNHVVAVVNTTIRIQNKTGTQLFSRGLGLSTSGPAFFAPLGPVNGLFDPKVIYDAIGGRFVVVALERRDTARGDPVNTSRILVAASQTSDPTGAWNYLAIDSKLNIGGLDSWADYPGFAADEEAIYIASNMFTFGASGIYRGSRLWIVDKSQFYSGAVPAVTVHDPFTAAGLTSNGTLQPAHISGTSGISGPVGTFLVNTGWAAGGIDSLAIIRLDNPLTAPTFTNQFVSVGDVLNGVHPNAPQPGTATLINTNDLRALGAVWRANRLYTCNTINPASGADTGQATAHWYVFDTTNLAALALLQQGNIGGEEITTGTHTFFPNITVNAAGDFIVGFAASSPTTFCGAYCAVHLSTDAPNTIRPSLTVAAGQDFYVRTFGSGRNRWGDYSGISVDPTDDSSFWVFNEYAMIRGTVFGGEDGRWGTRWGRITPGANIAPTLTLPGAAATFVENSVPLQIDPTATITDPDSADFNGGALTVSFAVNGLAEDRLSIRNEGNAAGQIGVSGASVSFGGAAIGTFAGGTNGATPLVVTFTSVAATPAAAEALARNVTYQNVSDNPSTATRTASFVISDGDGGTSAAAAKNIAVVAVNDAPTLDPIANPATILENAGLQTINLTGISAGGGENQTLVVTATSDTPTLIPNPTVSYTSPNTTGSLSYTPVANVSGSAMITVTVQDNGGIANGGVETITRMFTVNVTAVNSAPTLNAISDPAAVLEDAGAQTINLGGISAGPNESQTLTVTATSNNPGVVPNPTVTYTSPNANGSLSFTPVANQSGSATVTVTVQDNGGTANGGIDTISRTFTVSVIAVNDAPALAVIADPAAILEDAATQTINLAGISAGPNESQTLTVTAISNNTSLIPNPTVTYTSPNATGSITYSPVANASGSAVITVTVQDNGGTTNGGSDTVSRVFTVAVAAVNDPPTLNAISNPPAIPEDAGLQTINLSGISAGPNESQILTVTATSDNLALIPNPSVTYTSPNATGTLSYTPVANASGSATVTVQVQDNGGTANGGNNAIIRTFLVAVITDNPPTLAAIGDPAAILEDSGAQTVNLTGIGDGDGNTQPLTVTATSNNPALIPNPAVTYTTPNATGSLSYTPVANSFGSAVITVGVSDGNSTTTRNFTVTVTGVNDAPALAPITDPAAILEDALAQVVNLSGITAGPGESQTLTVTATSNNTALIPHPTVIYTSPDAFGSLNYTPVPNASGSALITVTLQDNSGTANGGADTVTRSFTVNVLPVNDAPLVNAIADPVAIGEDSSAQTINFSGINPGPGEAQNLTVTATSNNLALIPNPAVLYVSPNATGSLSYTPVANRSGSALITVTVQDNGGTVNGGLDAITRMFTVNVTAVNDLPTLNAIADPATIPVNSPSQTVNFAGISAGPNESDSLTVTASSNNPALIPNPAVTYTSPNPAGSLSYTPVAGQSGSAIISVTVDDGQAANNAITRTFTVVVAPANNAPTLAAITNPAPILEDAGAQTVSLTGIGDGDGGIQPVTITATSNNPSLIPNPAVTYTNPNASGSLSYTPAPNAFGTAVITVTANDGQTVNNVTTRTFTVAVSAVNDAPGLDLLGNQPPILEDASIQTVNLTGINAGAGETQTLTISATSDNPALIPNPSITYTNGNATGTLSYTLAPNAFGTATITVQVQDDGGTASGGINILSRTFGVSVTPVNDAPVFNPIPDPATILEDAVAQAINVSGVNAGPGESQTLTVTATSDNLAIIPHPSVNYNSPGTTALLGYTPVAQASGSAIITVTLSDDGGTANGGGNTVVRTFNVNVAPVNDAPTLNNIPDPAAILEDAPAQSISLAGLTAGANETQSLVVTASSSNPALIANPAITYTSPNSNGSLSYTPAAGQSGTAVIMVTVRDNGGTANGGVEEISRSFTVNVSAVNDAPGFVKGPDQTVLEDVPAQTIAGWATAISAGAANESAQAIDFIVTNDNATLFAMAPAIAPNGTLTFMPAPNANGTATVTVRIHDDGGTASGGINTNAPQTFTIALGPVNDAPGFTKGPDQTVLENGGAQTIAGWASALSAGPPDESAQTLQFVVGNSNGALFATAPAIAPDGTLTYTPALNANGTATVTAQLRDNGGTANGGADMSGPQTFTITLTAVNNPPAIDALASLTINEDAPAQNVALTGISPGASNESQTLTVTAVSNNPAVIPDPAVSYTSPSSSGGLTVVPLADANGSAMLTVTVRDDGGTANGGADLATRSFNVTVNPVNDAPGFVVGPNLTISSRAGPQSRTGATGISAGPADEAGQTLTFDTSTDQPALFATAPSVASDGTLTFTPLAGATGVATITLTLMDSGGTTNGGIDRSSAQSFTITLSSDNVAPSFIAGPSITLPLGATAFTQTGWATSISPGAPDESAQLVDFLVSNDNSALFSVAPAVAADGTLTFTPAPGRSGLAHVTVRAHDNGGTAGSGVDTSAPQTVIIAISTFAEEAGRYSGLIQAAAGGPREHARFGAINSGFTRKGAFSAKLTIGGKKFAVKGRVSLVGEVKFGKSGAATATLKRHDLPPLLLALTIDTVGGSDQLSGTLTENGAAFSTVLADRALYSRKKRPKPPLVNPPAELRGRFTLVFPAQTAAQTGVPEALFPQGDGIGFVKVSKSGRARLVGRLADGSKVTAGDALSKTNVFPFHALTDRKKGSITGPLTFRDQPLVSDLDGTNLVWFKPVNSGEVYPAGWTGGITVDLVGAHYRAPSGESALPGLSPPDANGNAVATLIDRALVPPLRIPLNIDARSDVAVVTTGPDRFALKINVRTGVLAGSFVHPQTGSKTSVVGVIVQKQGLGSGFFLSNGESGAFGLAPESPAMNASR